LCPLNKVFDGDLPPLSGQICRSLTPYIDSKTLDQGNLVTWQINKTEASKRNE